MSQIKDALKRAQEAQQENPPATPPLEFRSVEPEQQPRRRSTLLLVGLALVVVSILGLSALLVRFLVQSDANTLQVTARVADAPPIDPKAATGYIEHPDEPNTNGGPVVAEAVKPAPMKLQGIFFNPRNPSALVNGQSVYLGDRVGDFRVMGISPVAVTLVSVTETNVLSLSRP